MLIYIYLVQFLNSVIIGKPLRIESINNVFKKIFGSYFIQEKIWKVYEVLLKK